MEDLFEKKGIDKSINPDAIILDAGLDIFFPGIEQNHKRKIRSKTNHKYCKATLCSECGFTHQVQHHHNTDYYKVDKFEDLCQDCHNRKELIKRFAKSVGRQTKDIELMIEESKDLAHINSQFNWLFGEV